MTTHNIEVALFASFGVHIDGQQVTGVRSAKAQALLAYLILEPDRPHSRAALQALLWPELSTSGAKNALRVTLYRLRSALDEVIPGVSNQLLTVTRQTVQWNRDAADVDVQKFESRMTAVAAHGHEFGKPCAECQAHLLAAVTLAQGELLAGLDARDAAPFDEWLLMQRERLRAKKLTALAQMADFSLQQSNFTDAQTYALRQLGLDPLRELAHRQVLRSLLGRGLLGDAKRHYAQMEQLLQAELGVAPAPETAALLRQIRTGSADTGIPSSTSSATSDIEVGEEVIGAASDAPVAAPEPVGPRQFLGDAPLHGPFFGRQYELAHLRHWLLDEHCRLVTILGLGGMGKSALAARTMADITKHYDVVIWYTLLNAPEPPELLANMIHMLSEAPLPILPDGIEALLNLFFTYLQEKRTLIVLDNVESILSPEGHGTYRDGYEPYSQLFRRVALREHRGQILITSRERPDDIGQLEADLPWVRSLHLDGMDETAATDLLKTRGIDGTEEERSELASRYSGNPLALKLVAETIDEIFGGDIAVFLSEETAIFDDIRRVLDEHFARLSDLEQEILYWMALEREPISVPRLQADLLKRPSFRQLLEALRHLQRCSLVEPMVASQLEETQAEQRFGLQNVVLEYLTDRLIEISVAELLSGNLNILHRHALLKAQSKEYLRRSQIRLLIEPIVHRLENSLTHSDLSSHLFFLVQQLRTQIGRRPSYAGGTILNLMILQKIDLTGADFSGICLWQVDLQHASLTNVDLSQADLTNTTFRHTFGRLEILVASPDGRWLAGGGEGGDLRLYPLDETQPVVYLRGHKNTVGALCYSPDGTVLVSAGYDHMINMWDVETGEIQRTITAPSSVLSLSYSPDGTMVSSGESNGDIRIWHAESGELLAHIHGHTSPVTKTVFHPKGKYLASCGKYDTVRVWQIDSLLNDSRSRSNANLAHKRKPMAYPVSDILPVQELRSPDDQPLLVLGFSYDGRYLAAGTDGGTVMIGEILSEKPWRIAGSHKDVLLSLAFHPHRMILATSGDDATIRLWDATTGECTGILEGHDQAIWSVAFSPDGSTLASTSADGTIRRWQFTPSGELIPLRTLFGTIKGIETMVWSRDGRHIATGDLKGAIRLWEVDTPVPHCVHVIDGHAAVQSLGFTPDSRYLVSAGIDRHNAVCIWDVESGHLRETLHGHSTNAGIVAYAPNGHLLANALRSGTIELWNVDLREHSSLVRFLRGHESTLNALTFNPANVGLLASCGRDMMVRLWDTESGSELATLPSYGGNGAVQFDATGRFLAVEGQHHSVALWDVGDPNMPTRVLAFEGHADSPLSLTFHPDGSQMVSGSLDRTVRLWDTKTGQMMKTIGRHDGYVTSVAFSPDGQFVASAGKDGVAHIWCAESGERVHTLLTPGPYDGMNITGVTGINEAQRTSLKELGAVEE